MSLLEGHADVVMDEVGPEVVPSVGLIRERFTARRTKPKPAEALVRRAIGMDAKLKQYSQGAAFVRAVIADRGMTGFNAIWTSPETLPTKDEIDNPNLWLARVS
jgi:putative hydrolase